MRANPLLKPAENLKEGIEGQGEVLLEGYVPSSAIKSAGSMRLTQGLRFVQVIGIASPSTICIGLLPNS
jgi:hypothetical protein